MTALMPLTTASYKINLLKGSYAIDQRERAKCILAIVTPDGLFQFRAMLFGFKISSAMFQCLMNPVLAGHSSYTTDNIAEREYKMSVVQHM